VGSLVVAFADSVEVPVHAAPGLVEGWVLIWDPSESPPVGRYEQTELIPVGAAFWVKRIEIRPEPLRLRIPVPGEEDTTLARTAERTATSRALGDLEWAVVVTAEQGGRSAAPLVLGAAPEARQPWSASTRSLPPFPPGADRIAIYVEKASWGPWNGKYVTDVLPVASTMTWDFTLETTRAGESVTLRFEPRDVPEGYTFRLTEDGGWSHETIVPGAAVSLEPVAPRRQMRLEARRGPGVEDEPGPDLVVRAAPNPFTAATEIYLSLPRQGPVTAVVLDALGRRVADLMNGVAPAGRSRLFWNGRDASGREVAAGVYFVRFNAQHETRMVRLLRLR
jgi:hypothetical protein